MSGLLVQIFWTSPGRSTNNFKLVRGLQLNYSGHARFYNKQTSWSSCENSSGKGNDECLLRYLKTKGRREVYTRPFPGSWQSPTFTSPLEYGSLPGGNSYSLPSFPFLDRFSRVGFEKGGRGKGKGEEELVLGHGEKESRILFGVRIVVSGRISIKVDGSGERGRVSRNFAGFFAPPIMEQFGAHTRQYCPRHCFGQARRKSTTVGWECERGLAVDGCDSVSTE